jgi:hypothetical protein
MLSCALKFIARKGSMDPAWSDPSDIALLSLAASKNILKQTAENAAMCDL